MVRFKRLKKKIEKREEKFKEELCPFARAKLTVDSVDKYYRREIVIFRGPTEEEIDKEVEEIIANVKNMLERISRIRKATSLNELLEIIYSGQPQLLKNWKDAIEKLGYKWVCNALESRKGGLILYMPGEVERLIRAYRKAIAKKARELKNKKQTNKIALI